VYAAVQPEVVVNCAAFHNLDACESNPEYAWRVNVDAVRGLAIRSVPLVHISTNYVFNGEQSAPYGEGDLPSPTSIYAVTKLAGEHVALAYGTSPLVVRTAGLYGLSGSASKGGNFVQRLVARAGDERCVKMVADQRLQPTFTADLAEAIIEAVGKKVTGVVHLTAGGECSWFDFAAAINELAGLDLMLESTATVAGPGAIRRPMNGVLARTRADDLGLPHLRHWQDGLRDYMSRAGLIADRHSELEIV
jgi:dTDP-4-dehydrorhamnose reductase